MQAYVVRKLLCKTLEESQLVDVLETYVQLHQLIQKPTLVIQVNLQNKISHPKIYKQFLKEPSHLQTAVRMKQLVKEHRLVPLLHSVTCVAWTLFNQPEGR